mgnify:CR=1 FL=1
MLKIDPDHGFAATAEIRLKALQATFNIRCRLLDVDQLEAVQKEQAEGLLTPADFVATWLLGWDDGEVCIAGETIPYTPQGLDRLLKVPGAAVAMTRAFYSGYEEAEQKNSAPLPATS